MLRFNTWLSNTSYRSWGDAFTACLPPFEHPQQGQYDDPDPENSCGNEGADWLFSFVAVDLQQQGDVPFLKKFRFDRFALTKSFNLASSLS